MGDSVCSDGEEVMLRMFVGMGVIVWASAGCDSVFLKRGMVVVIMEILEVASWAVETNHPVWFSVYL